MKLRIVLTAALAVLLIGSGDALAALVHHWNLDDDVTGGIASDSVGGANGVIGAAVASVPGVVGSAMQFAAGDPGSEVSIAGFSTTGLEQMTLAFWMKPTGDTMTPGFKRVISAADNFEAVINANAGTLGNNLYAGGGAYPSTTDPLEEGRWVHVALTSDVNPPGSGAMEIYINGILAGGSPDQADDPFGGGEFKFGHRPGRPDSERYTGLLDDIRIYDTVLSQAEIRAIIPEPSSILLLLLACGCGVCRRYAMRS